MSNYSKSTNFATKDNLSPGNPLKIVKGTEIDTEFNNIATAVATKTDNSSATITGGTINGAVIGGTTAAAGTFTNLTVSTAATIASAAISAGTINGAVIGGSSPLAITGTNITANTGFSGPLTGAVTGNVTGNLTGNVTGNVTGNITGNVTGNVTAATGTSTFNNVTISGALDMDSATAATITGLASPTNDSDAATKGYVDALAQGIDAKASVVAATTANITLSGAQTIDGISIVAGDRVLVKDQSTASNNGIYLCATGSWTRTTDADTYAELVAAFTFVEKGTTNADSGFICTIDAGGTLGSTSITWAQFSGAGQITAGDGLTKTGNTLNVGTASSSRIVVNGDNIDLASSGVTPGTYQSVTFDTYGRATAGTNPTTIAGYNITNAYTKTEIDSIFGSTTAAATSASNAATSASNASTSASNASTSASNAATSETNAAASYDAFDDRYLGSKSSAPSVDNDGNALLTGALYWNNSVNTLYVWTGSAWTQAAFTASGFATLTGTETLTNKTLTSPIISSISNTGTLTLPTSTDTLVGRATTDTLTNKTLTAPTIASANLTTALTVTGASGTSGQVLTSGGSGAAPTWSTLSAGNFSSDLSSVNYTLTLPTELSNAVVFPFIQTVSLTATTEMMLIHSSSSIQAVVFDSSAGTFGTVVLVRSGGNFGSYNFVGCIGISTTQVLVCSLPSASTALETVVLSVSGSTITVNTAVATTLATTSNLTTSNNRLVKVGSSYVLHYYITGNFPAFRAITVSGTTPTVGAQTALGAGTYVNSTSYAYDSSTLLFIYYTSAVGVTAQPYTISGTTITAGTGATLFADNNVMVTGLLSTGRIAILFLNGEGQCGVINVTGTTASFSVVGTTLEFGTWAPRMQVYGNQAFVTSGITGNIADKLQVITDTSGTATVGTAISSPGAMVGFLSTGKLLTTSNSTSGNSAYNQYGISSGSPVLEKSFSNVSNVNSATTLSLNGIYGVPYAGPPNSDNGATGLSIRTSAGKTVPLVANAVPFAISIDGTSNGKYQQGVAFGGRQATDALSGDTGWSILQLQAPSTTTLQLIKVKVS